MKNKSIITKLRRDRRAPHFKPLTLLIALDILDEQKYFSPVVPAKIIIERFQGLSKIIGLKKTHSKGFMPFWHLSGDNIFIHYSNKHELVSNSLFKFGKPKSKSQLLSKVDYVIINQSKLNYFNNKIRRKKLRKEIFSLLKKDNNENSKKILKHFNV